jgi:hypothetical protein
MMENQTKAISDRQIELKVVFARANWHSAGIVSLAFIERNEATSDFFQSSLY